MLRSAPLLRQWCAPDPGPIGLRHKGPGSADQRYALRHDRDTLILPRRPSPARHMQCPGSQPCIAEFLAQIIHRAFGMRRAAVEHVGVVGQPSPPAAR